MAMTKEEKELLQKKKLTDHMIILCLVTCEGVISRNAYLEKKWGNFHGKHNPYTADRLTWMEYRKKLRFLLQSKYMMKAIIQEVKSCKDKATQKEVEEVIGLINRGDYAIVSDSRQ